MENRQILKKMMAIMADIGVIKKEGYNDYHKFRFRGIDQFVNSLHPVLVKHGVIMIPRVVSSERHSYKSEKTSKDGAITGSISFAATISVCYDFMADDGSVVTVGPICAEGMDNGDKATTKALSAALKYALIQTFCVPTEDMIDGDAMSPSVDDDVRYEKPRERTAALVKPKQKQEKPYSEIDFNVFCELAKSCQSFSDLEQLYKANRECILVNERKDDLIQLFNDMKAAFKSVENERSEMFNEFKVRIKRVAFEDSLKDVKEKMGLSNLTDEQIKELDSLIERRRLEIIDHGEVIPVVTK